MPLELTKLNILTTSSVLISVAVTPEQALKLIHATRTENLYFALRSDGVEIK